MRHSHAGVPAEEFHSVTVDSKNGPLAAWLHGPVPRERPRPASGRTSTPSASGAAPHTLQAPAQAFDFGGATVNGGVFGGTNQGIGGGTFYGDIHLGDGGMGDRR